MDKKFYNESSSESLGWSPDWLGASDFDDDLIKRIVAFQKKHGLKADGLLGPGTYRRLWTEREAEIETYTPIQINSNGENYLIYNNNYIPIMWDRVVLPFNRGGLKHTNGYKKMIEKRNISMFVTHWMYVSMQSHASRFLTTPRERLQYILQLIMMEQSINFLTLIMLHGMLQRERLTRSPLVSRSQTLIIPSINHGTRETALVRDR